MISNNNYGKLVPLFNEEALRLIFTSNLTVLNHTSKEIRSLAMENLARVFEICQEPLQEI